MFTAVERWNTILEARAKQMDAAYARLNRTSEDFWDRRARGYHRSTKDTVARDPFYLKLRNIITPKMSVLDVGAGTGRFTLELAPQAKHITAVEPNATMLDYLRRDAQERTITNITSIHSTWQDAPADLQADVVICSHVLYPIQDIIPFLEKLQSATHETCYLYLRATHIDAVTGHLWQHFHGEERRLPPGYISVLDILFEMGIYANVEIVELPVSICYPSLAVAVEELTEQLILPDNEHTRDELGKLLVDWLIERDGVLVPPVEKMVCAILWWRVSQ